MTPLSDAALLRFDAFTARVRARLEAGKQTYGDASHERPLPQLIEELRQEVEDQCGWAFIMWARLDRLEQLAEEANGPHRRSEDVKRVPIYMGWPGDIKVQIGEAPG